MDRKKLKEFDDKFYKIFKEELEDKLVTIEEKRQNKLTLYYFLVIITFLPSALCILKMLETKIYEFCIFAICFLILAMPVIHLITHMLPKKYRFLLKKQISNKAARIFDCYNLEYIEENHPSIISDSDLDDMKLENQYSKHDKMINDDSYIGNIGEKQFKISETELIHQTVTGKSKGSVTTFKGVILSIENISLSENIPVYIKYETKKEPVEIFLSLIGHMLLGALFLFLFYITHIIRASSIIIWAVFIGAIAIGSYYLKSTRHNQKNKTITVEREKGTCYLDSTSIKASNEAMDYNIIEYSEELLEALDATEFKAAFVNNKFLIAFSTKRNLFETGSLFEPVMSEKAFNNYMNDFIAIFDFLETIIKRIEKSG